MPHPIAEITATMSKDGTVFLLTMPYPDHKTMKALSPHAEGKSYRAKATATKFQRTAAKLISGQCTPRTPWSKGRVYFHYFKPDNRILDELNMATRFKAAIDGVVDAGLLPNDNDKHLTVGSMTTSVDKLNPRVEITIERIGGGV